MNRVRNLVDTDTTSCYGVAMALTSKPIKTYTNSDGSVSAVRYRAEDGAEFTISERRKSLSWADSSVWLEPERYGLHRYFCPGHGRSRICPYGQHDEIRANADFGAAS